MTSRKLVAMLVAFVLAVGMCPVAFAADAGLGPAQMSDQSTQHLSYIDQWTISEDTRIPEGDENLNPVKSVKDSQGKALKEGTDYYLEYFSSDNYYDLTAKLDAAPTKAGRYLAVLRPIDTDKYNGLRVIAYQITGKDFVERLVSEKQAKDVTGISAEGAYSVLWDTQTPWTHYTKSQKQIDEWVEQGFRYGGGYFDGDAVLYFTYDPNNGQYRITPSDGLYVNNAFTMKGLTYNMPLCVAVAEASYTLNKGYDVVSSEEGYDVSAKKTWVSTEAYTALKKAIAQAEEVGTTKGASSSKVKAATTKLNKALKNFKPAAGKKGQKRSIAKATVTGVSAKTYTGKVIKLKPVVKLNGKKLVAGKHYTVTYKNAKGKTVKAKNVKAAGTYKVVVKGKGYCKGAVTKTFKVKAVSMKAKAVKVAKVKTQKLVKSGKAVKPKLTVKFGKTVLKAGKDYKVTYKNNKKAGTAKAIIKGKGNFSGTRTVTFKIK